VKKKDKIIISVLAVWTFIHSYFLLFNINTDRVYWHFSTEVDTDVIANLPVTKFFYPFTYSEIYSAIYPQAKYFNLEFYDYSEYFIYVVGAWVGFFIYKFLKGNK
jgi:hypothetical protein